MVGSSPTCKKTSFSNSASNFLVKKCWFTFWRFCKKSQKFIFFHYFSTKNTIILLKSNRNRLNSTRAFDWCIIVMHFKNKFFCFFLVRVPPYVKNGPKYFFIETWQFIHHLKALVEFRRFLWLLKSFTVFLVEKFSKNSEKI